ncbi:dynamin-like GTPase mgm1 [Allomyces arbusculus]|nr:dynamin-like GTPase mgm1 [Allomyces arbusculus]
MASAIDVIFRADTRILDLVAPLAQPLRNPALFATSLVLAGYAHYQLGSMGSLYLPAGGDGAGILILGPEADVAPAPLVALIALIGAAVSWAHGQIDDAKEAILHAVTRIRDDLDDITTVFFRDASSGSPGAAPGAGDAGPSGLGPQGSAPFGAAGGANPDEDEFMDLTKKLIEVRNILKAVKITGNLVLPSIVVIGSQSSGKSSVLEAIVGREFLPKGTNMVTRRPLELTLIHTPDSTEEYGEFPQLGFGKVTNFQQIQRTLYDLNMAVQDECISDKPIELRIYSPNVPDLTLVDLPGYIQIHSKNQPRDLKEKIADLCEKYIQEPNVILAVCAADVDLANSEALRASRKADPLGLRTIGVLTKLDLVSPEMGEQLIAHNDYPLHLGYVGVVCGGKNPQAALVPFQKRDLTVGVPYLRQLLMRTLEERMGSRLSILADAVDQELAEASYQFKVMYNDRRITAESYLAETMDTLKHRFKDFARQFGKPQVRQEVRTMLEERIVEICEQLYWQDPKQQEMATAAAKTDPYWSHKLNLASSALTKSGVGRASTQLVVDSLMSHMEKLITNEPFVHHPDTRRKVLQLANEIIRHKFHTTVDQVENTIKPYKFEVECTDLEWAEGTKRAVAMLEREIQASQKAYDSIKSVVGRRTLNGAISYLTKLDKEKHADHPLAGTKPAPESSMDMLLRAVPSDPGERPSGYTDTLLAKARTALYYDRRMNNLYNRLYHIKSRSCRSPECQDTCPEIFLECVSEKLTYTAVMFIYIELLNEFFFQFPRDVDERLYYDLTKNQIAAFARENQSVRKQLDLMDRKAVLDLAQLKLRALVRRQEEIERKKREQERAAARGY